MRPAALLLVLLLVGRGPAGAGAEPKGPTMVVTYPAAKGCEPSKDYAVEVNGRAVFVYTAKVLRGGPASFAYFDFSGTVAVKVTPKARAVRGAVVRPMSRGVKPAVQDGAISFRLDRPGNFSVEPDGRRRRPLLLFANPVETDRPDRRDPNVIYFGPGNHEIAGTRKIPSNTTVYIAGGAVVRGRLLPDEKSVGVDKLGSKHYRPLLLAENAENVVIRGRGILDGSALPIRSKSPICLTKCTGFLVEGIIIRDSPVWNMPAFQCRKGVYRNVKAIAHRENSDGINICNSQDIVVEGCFIRTNDDEICIKAISPPPAPEPKNITVRDCVVWNERAHGLGITYETRTNVSGVLFKNCDVIHDTGFASLAVYAVDSGTISGVRFVDCRVEHAGRLILLKIGHDMWAHDKTRGHVKGVTFKDVSYTGNNSPRSVISGFDAGHLVEDVTFDNLRIGGKLVHGPAAGGFSIRHARNVRFVTGTTPPPAPARGEQKLGD